MSTAGLFLLVAVTVGVVTFIVWPLISTSASTRQNIKPINLLEQAPILVLQADRAAILTTLRDLDFDYETGKVIEDDYHRQREALLMRGAAILRQIDLLQADEIEAAVAAKRPKIKVK